MKRTNRGEVGIHFDFTESGTNLAASHTLGGRLLADGVHRGVAGGLQQLGRVGSTHDDPCSPDTDAKYRSSTRSGFACTG